MRVFLHDGSFDGLLTALARALETPDARTAPEAGWTPDLLDRPEPVTTDPDAARRLLDRARARLGPASVRRLLYAHHAEQPDIEPCLRDYLSLGFQLGPAVEGYRTHPAVRRVLDLGAAVGGEIHRLKGLLRFRRLASGWLWAPARPDYNIILPVGLHFRRRLSMERWGIHDLGRGIAVLWEHGRLEECPAGCLPARLAEIEPERLDHFRFPAISSPGAAARFAAAMMLHGSGKTTRRTGTGLSAHRDDDRLPDGAKSVA